MINYRVPGKLNEKIHSLFSSFDSAELLMAQKEGRDLIRKKSVYFKQNTESSTNSWVARLLPRIEEFIDAV